VAVKNYMFTGNVSVTGKKDPAKLKDYLKEAVTLDIDTEEHGNFGVQSIELHFDTLMPAVAPEKPRNIVNASKLLADIAEGLKGRKLGDCNDHTRIGCVDVLLFRGKEKKPIVSLSLPSALEYLADDVFFSEKGNWSDADRAEVRPM
jgi:hypothetical protein